MEKLQTKQLVTGSWVCVESGDLTVQRGPWVPAGFPPLPWGWPLHQPSRVFSGRMKEVPGDVALMWGSWGRHDINEIGWEVLCPPSRGVSRAGPAQVVRE